MGKVAVIFLGTNGWYDTEIGNTTSTLVETDSDIIILDAGFGIYKAARHLKKNKRVSIFLSHFHLDHIAGLHVLNRFEGCAEVAFYGPSGMENILKTILNTPISLPISKLPFKVKINELAEGKYHFPCKFECLPLVHSTTCFGYRFEFPKKVAYIADTSYCTNAVTLAREADLLITECSYLSGEGNPNWPHLNPENAARIAKEACAKKLFLTHFDASRYTSLDKRAEARRAAAKIFRRTHVARDGLKLSL